MADVIVTQFMTLDGVMEAPGGEPGHPHTGWVMPHASDEWERFKYEETRDAGTLLIGRTTYESFAEAWPQRTGEFADRMNTMPKVVVSTTLAEPGWDNTRVVPDVSFVPEIAGASEGPVLVTGSRILTHALFAVDLVDEVRIMLFPVSVGGGDCLFPDGHTRIDLIHTDTRTFDNGVVLLTYRTR